MNMKMLDTNIFIYMMRHQPEYLIRKFNEERKKGLCLSSVTYGELREGVEKSSMQSKNNEKLSLILNGLKIIPFDDKAAYEYGRIKAQLYRSGFTVGDLDIQIAAVAIANDMILVTNNTKDFHNIHSLEIEDWLIR